MFTKELKVLNLWNVRVVMNSKKFEHFPCVMWRIKFYILNVDEICFEIELKVYFHQGCN